MNDPAPLPGVVDGRRLAANKELLLSLRDRFNALESEIIDLTASNHCLVSEAQQLAEQTRFQVAEIEHRLTNTFATLQALIMQTTRPGDTGAEFRAIFGARLLSLASSHELLKMDHSDGAPLCALVERCLQPYAEPAGRTNAVGALVHLPAHRVPVVGLIFHELATNAAKYGALSVPEGTLNVSWQIETTGVTQSNSVVIIWQEANGPHVYAPQRRGFGTRLLEQGLARGANGSVELDFAPHGLTCRITLGLEPFDAGRPIGVF